MDLVFIFDIGYELTFFKLSWVVNTDIKVCYGYGYYHKNSVIFYYVMGMGMGVNHKNGVIFYYVPVWGPVMLLLVV